MCQFPALSVTSFYPLKKNLLKLHFGGGPQVKNRIKRVTIYVIWSLCSDFQQNRSLPPLIRNPLRRHFSGAKAAEAVLQNQKGLKKG